MSIQRAAPTAAGVSVPEVIVALLLGLFLAHFGLSSMARLRNAEARLAARREGLIAMRVARFALRSELRHGVPERDWRSDGDSIGLRAFRGTALVCAQDASSAQLTVSFSGIRRPDPTKDSVLLLGVDGPAEVRALRGVRAAPVGCGSAPPSALEQWVLDRPVGPGTVVGRLFERGSYHLARSALRYRRGESGRQPLTPEVLGPGTGWVRLGDRLGLEVQYASAAEGAGWSAFLAWAGAP